MPPVPASSSRKTEHWSRRVTSSRECSRHLTGDLEGARGPLEEGGRGGSAAAPHVQTLRLAQLALLMIEDEDWEGAATVTARARSQLEAACLQNYATLALVFAVSGLVRAHRGMSEEARRDARQSVRLRGAAQRLRSLVRGRDSPDACAGRAPPRPGHRSPGAAGRCRSAATCGKQPDSPVLREWLDECNTQLGAATRWAEESWTLTTAELRVLRSSPPICRSQR